MIGYKQWLGCEEKERKTASLQEMNWREVIGDWSEEFYEPKINFKSVTVDLGKRDIIFWASTPMKGLASL